MMPRVANKTVETGAISVLPKQREFIEAGEREVLYSGAYGAGKSRALCLKLVARVSGRPRAVEGLCRKHLVTLRATTLRTLLEPDGDLPPVLPLGSYIHRKTDKTIQLYGGGRIEYFGIDDETKIGSRQFTGVAVDEATELTERDWRQLRGRLRARCAGLPQQLYAACNPHSPLHHLAVRFGFAGSPPARGCRAIVTCTADNWFLPDEYVADLQTFEGLARARYVLGQWVGSEGLVYDRWSRAEFVRERAAAWRRIAIGVDEGYVNPACLLVVAEDGDRRIHVLGEWYKRQQLEASVVAEALKLRMRYGAVTFVIDPSASKLSAALQAAGCSVVPADNRVFAGIQAVQQRLTVAGDGKPMLTVDPLCTNLIREFETYEWKEGARGMRDEPLKVNDHAMDALRYAVMYLDGQATGRAEYRGFGSPMRRVGGLF